MKSFKPKDPDVVYGIMPGYDTNDLFIDIKFLDLYRKAAKGNMMYRLGKNVFVFDVEACEFFEEICENCINCEEQIGGDGYCYMLRAGVYLDEACPQNSFVKKEEK